MLPRGGLTVQCHEKNCLAVHRSVTARNYKATGPFDRADGKSKKKQPPPYCPPLSTSGSHRPPVVQFPSVPSLGRPLPRMPRLCAAWQSWSLRDDRPRVEVCPSNS